MPRSRYVSADRARRVIVYVFAAFLFLVLTDVGIRVLGLGQTVRRLVAIAWVIALPAGGWIVWRRSARSGPH